ncbi:MAG: PEP-CTERM sorting domain-containing protein [Alphaproteobacteria bacterium]|nr:PEP-CTERM sorting domain-containing protein [Alphaproteobacteria bacterium]
MVRTGHLRDWLSAAALVVAALAYTAPVRAQSLSDEPDPLHGFCYGSSSCSDNGTITATLSDPPEFGFSKSPANGSTDQFLLEVLVPNNVAGATSESFILSGTDTSKKKATSSLVSTTAWTSGSLDTYLGISGSVSNPISAFLPTTQVDQPSATGYFDYQLNFGSVHFSMSRNPEFTTKSLFPEGTIIVAFADSGTTTTDKKSGLCLEDYVATASSGAIAITGSHHHEVPEPATLGLFALGSLALAGLRRRRR